MYPICAPVMIRVALCPRKRQEYKPPLEWVPRLLHFFTHLAVIAITARNLD
jgi:hypothetical protein